VLEGEVEGAVGVKVLLNLKLSGEGVGIGGVHGGLRHLQ
jgi:hypothetical protein